MEALEITIIATQLIALLIYRWVGKNYYLQPRHNHPAIFWNKTYRMLLCNVPSIVMISMVILAFFVIDYPWWFMIISFILAVTFAPDPRKIK